MAAGLGSRNDLIKELKNIFLLRNKDATRMLHNFHAQEIGEKTEVGHLECGAELCFNELKSSGGRAQK